MTIFSHIHHLVPLQRPFSAKGERSKEPLQLVHSNVCGPLSVQARGGYEYFVTFIDDYSRYGYVYLMHKKSETLGKLKEFMAEAEKQLGKSLKTLRSDREGEYLHTEFKDHMLEHGILSQLTTLEHHRRMVLQKGETGRY